MEIKSADAIEAAISTMSDDDLFEEMGKRRIDRLSLESETREALVRSGKQFWSQSSALVRELVCNNAEFQDAAKKDAGDIATFVLLALGTHFHSAVVGYLAVMTVRRVLQGWCNPSPT